MRIGIVAPSGRFSEDAALKAEALAGRIAPDAALVFHPQCFRTHGHFAGTDEERRDAFVEMANDPAIDAIWFARGGYGGCRFAEEAIAALGPAAGDKTYLGYSDSGYLLAGLYKAGIGTVAHGPLVNDLIRKGGEAAFSRALGWLTQRDPAALEPTIVPEVPHAAFNITVLGLMMGTALEPPLKDHILMLEDVAEHAYRTDRAMFHLTNQQAIRSVAGIRVGRISDVPDNDPDFGMSGTDIVRFWCDRAGIAFLGETDIGHDAGNRVVPFGAL